MSETEETVTVEIGGQKFDIEKTRLRMIHQFKVGDPVRVLVKSGWGNDIKWESKPGTIVGYHDFQNKPCIVVAQWEDSYTTDVKVKLHYIVDGNKEVQLATIPEAELFASKRNVVEQFDRAIKTKHDELEHLQQQKAYFLDQFGAIVDGKLESA